MSFILPIISILAYCFGYTTISGIIGCIFSFLFIAFNLNDKVTITLFAVFTGIIGAFLPYPEDGISYILHVGSASSMALLAMALLALVFTLSILMISSMKK